MGIFKKTYFILLLLALSACSGYERVKRSADVNYKLEMADKYYEKKSYQYARELYESLMPIVKGTKNFEAMYYKYAMSCFLLKDYNSASYHFNNFTNSFPNAANIDEAEFMKCYSIYKMSPKLSVNQSTTEKGVEVLQTYISQHPESNHLDEAKTLMQELKSKLENKAVAAAKLYYDIGQYKAATIVYKNLQTEFPFSTRMDQYQFMIVKAHYKFAKASIKSKQEERFVEVISAYQELVDTYPKSSLLPEAEKYYTLATNHIKNLKK